MKSHFPHQSFFFSFFLHDRLGKEGDVQADTGYRLLRILQPESGVSTAGNILIWPYRGSGANRQL